MFTRKNKDTVSSYPTGFPRGLELLHDPVMNKGTAFTAEERDVLGLWGLLPPRICTLEEQEVRVLENFRRKPTNLERYIQMMALLDRNETLFYRIVVNNIETMMPVIYMPTVGQACKEYGHIMRKPRGIYLSAMHRGRFTSLLRNWSHDEVRTIVVTDGERIFGLGDLGAAGMGSSIGKLILYTALAGVHPSYGLPVTLDVGTNNPELIDDPLYIGIPQRRLREEAYDGLVDEFVAAVEHVFPEALIQFEDMATGNAVRLLRRYRDRACVFNNDIQGRAAVILAGLYAALRITEERFRDMQILFLGASEGSIAMGDLIVAALRKEGLTEEEARRRCWFMDSKGLVVQGRCDLEEHKLPFAHHHPPVSDLITAVEALRPKALIGACGVPGIFTNPVLQAMARFNERPIVFALSHPSSRAECTAREAANWTEGRAVFACSGCTDPGTPDRKAAVPVHVNTACITPGLVLGCIVSEATRLTDDMFLAAAAALAESVPEKDLDKGILFPPLPKIRRVSPVVAEAVAMMLGAEQEYT